MNHGSLFSGIGGFDLAAHWMGWNNIFHCEWNEFGQKVLKYHFPKSISYGDIAKTDFTIHRGAIDLISGGFPCQPYSSAGKRLGKEDERHLWPEMCRAIGEIAPRWVVGENVRGLTNWNGGVVFDEVCADLENLGYQVAPYLIPACATNAPHKRERIWFVAYSESNGNRGELQRLEKKDVDEWKSKKYGENHNEFRNDGEEWNASNAKSEQGQRSKFEFNENCKSKQGEFRGVNRPIDDRPNDWSEFPIEFPVCGRNDGIPAGLDGITFPKWRNESIKAYGNAICPQVALQIFKTIQEYENLSK
jgi:DNA (cytosine-5)-methyltransferase 1